MVSWYSASGRIREGEYTARRSKSRKSLSPFASVLSPFPRVRKRKRRVGDATGDEGGLSVVDHLVDGKDLARGPLDHAWAFPVVGAMTGQPRQRNPYCYRSVAGLADYDN